LSGPGLTQLFLKLRNGAIFPALVEQLTFAEQRKHGLKPMDPSDQRLELTQLFFMRLANQFKPYIGF
jgi:hypothetical protein